jgi:hypothetical protein
VQQCAAPAVLCTNYYIACYEKAPGPPGPA